MEQGTVLGIVIGGVITVVNAFFAYLVSRDKSRFDNEKAHLQWQVQDLKEDGAKCEQRAAALEKQIDADRDECATKLAAMQRQIDELKRTG